MAVSTAALRLSGTRSAVVAPRPRAGAALPRRALAPRRGVVTCAFPGMPTPGDDKDGKKVGQLHSMTTKRPCEGKVTGVQLRHATHSIAAIVMECTPRYLEGL